MVMEFHQKRKLSKNLPYLTLPETNAPGEANKDNAGEGEVETGNDVGGVPFKTQDEEDTRN